MLRLELTRGLASAVAAGASSEKPHQAVQKVHRSQRAKRRTLSSLCQYTDSEVAFQNQKCVTGFQVLMQCSNLKYVVITVCVVVCVAA